MSLEDHAVVTVPAVTQEVSTAPRAVALDALRGLAILLMIFSGLIPFDRPLPVWMYHAQEPPPTHNFNPNLPGLTFVDLVFPMFLFSMGAAIPLALSRRMDRGVSWWTLILGFVQRGLLLGWFAIFSQHIRPYTMEDSPSRVVWLTALTGFALLFAEFTRLPQRIPRAGQFAIRAVGWLGAFALLFFWHNGKGERFSVERSDIILIVLANVVVFASCAWALTRDNLLGRLGIFGAILAFRLAAPLPGWVHTVWNWSPVPWLYQMYYSQYLLIVLIGTIAGDLLRNWEQERQEEPETAPAANAWLLACVGLTLTILLLCGLEARWLWQTTLLALALGLLAKRLIALPHSPDARMLDNAGERLLRGLTAWGVYWLLLGLAFEPYEGGIKKDHPTVSYYFVTSGISLFLLITFTVLIAATKRFRWYRLLADTGQNPMIGYCGMSNFIWPVLALTGLDVRINALSSGAWPGVVKAALETLLLALLVSVCTRRGLFWRT